MGAETNWDGVPVQMCYVDESGMGDDPIATMVGMVLDSSRMHVTKDEWTTFLVDLSELAGRELQELHTSDFYAGNGRFRDIDGPRRADIISAIFRWLRERKHSVVYASVVKAVHADASLPQGLETVWRMMGWHVVLAMQQRGMRDSVPKGHTNFTFDDHRERPGFQQLIFEPPDWTDEYYKRDAKRPRLDQVVDVPSFHDSKLVPMLQVADFATFFLRRYAEISEGLSEPRYEEEEEFVQNWIGEFASRSIGKRFIYPSQKQTPLHKLFFDCAPPSIRELG